MLNHALATDTPASLWNFVSEAILCQSSSFPPLWSEMVFALYSPIQKYNKNILNMHHKLQLSICIGIQLLNYRTYCRTSNTKNYPYYTIIPKILNICFYHRHRAESI